MALSESSTDALVSAFLMDDYRTQHGSPVAPDNIRHLVSCPAATATETSRQVEGYGCDTGCEVYVLTAEVGCPHVEAVEWEYSAFGDMHSLIWELERFRLSRGL